MFIVPSGYQIVLASGSPRRKELLGGMGLSFTVQTKEVEETYPSTLVPREAVVYLSKKKGMAVASILDEKKIIISSDTLVDLMQQPLGKPQTKEHAFEMLRSLSGKTHEVHTGICIICGEKILVDSDTTKVEFKELTDQEIWDYIATGEPMDKAGAYAIQGIGGKFIKRIQGEMDTVMGFPCKLCEQLLCQLGLEK